MVALREVEAALHRLYIGADGSSLRKEDRKKAAEIVAFLSEIEMLVGKARRTRMTLVDAAAGKAYVGLLAAELLLGPAGRSAHVVLIEREPRHAAACRRAVAELGKDDIDFTVREADVGDDTAWPASPDVVVALHACGPASDTTIDQAIRSRARHVLLVPCCTSTKVAASALAIRKADALGLPRHAEVRRRFVESIVAAERTLRLEAAGYETVVVPFVPPTVTPHNLLWRSRRVEEPSRMRRAAADLQRLYGG